MSTSVIPPSILQAMATQQEEVYGAWIADHAKNDNASLIDDVLLQIWSAPEYLEGGLELRVHLLNALMDAPHPPSHEMIGVLEKYFPMLLVSLDNPGWVSWVQTPLHKSSKIDVLHEWIKTPLFHNQSNTLNAMWDIACSIPSHFDNLNTTPDRSAIGMFLKSYTLHPPVFDRLYALMQKSLAPDIVDQHLILAANTAFAFGDGNILSNLINKGLSLKHIESIAMQKCSFTEASHLSCIRSFEWMLDTNAQHCWSLFEPDNAQKMFNNLINNHLVLSPLQDLHPADPVCRALGLAQKLFTQVLSGDEQVAQKTLRSFIDQNNWDGVDWMLDMLDDQHIKDVVRELSKDQAFNDVFKNNPRWSQHPRVSNVLIDDAVNDGSYPSPRPKKM